ncbi:hypothetical protein [Parachryseolinea silvisoli]|jgi:hypothetical protein|uniref:hypothetical protein n=1 Tax=Parachryseolinea silvisoli TaxID=2873601 RepID=UPI002265C8F2|nr:hypothetical protein [Parachryseolinea silvisoli]MCD9017670.1 hypothetical protein [Parachryseolinea silvisoli]
MEAFCSEIVAEIREAQSEAELIKVIGHSISQLRKDRKSYNESGYIMNMIVSLRSTKPGEVTTETLDNVKLAIAIFRQFQKESRERIC